MIYFNKKIGKFVKTKFYGSQNAMVLDKEESLIPYLSDILKIDEGTTFEEFFDPIIQNWAEYEIVFESHLKGFSLEKFYKEWNKPTTKSTSNDPIKYLEIFWHPVEINEEEPNDDAYWCAGFHGWGKWIDNTGKELCDGGHSIEQTPINLLRKYPFKLNESIDILKVNYTKRIYDNVVLKFNTSLTVYDVIGAILFEISYHGEPSDRDYITSEMNNISNALDDPNFDKSDFLEIKFDEDGNIQIGNKFFKDYIKEIYDNTPTVETELDKLLKKFNIDKPKDDGK